MRTRQHTKGVSTGYCLAELMAVLSVLAVCLVIGFAHLSGVLKQEQARGSAQSTQAAVAWAQLGALWSGTDHEVSFGTRGLVVSGEASPGTALNSVTPVTHVTSNVFRWNTLEGIVVDLLSPWATPDSGGSLFFGDGGLWYKVTVRPESGLTVRDRVTPR